MTHTAAGVYRVYYGALVSAHYRRSVSSDGYADWQSRVMLTAHTDRVRTVTPPSVVTTSGGEYDCLSSADAGSMLDDTSAICGVMPPDCRSLRWSSAASFTCNVESGGRSS